MSKTKKYSSPAMAAIHETAGAIDKHTMREFDDTCLTPVIPLTADEISDIRENEHVSQTVFAYYLNVSKGVISQWERGAKHPAGTSLKLLTLVAKNGLAAIA